MFNSAIIKKGKSEKANKAKKVSPSLLHGMEELEAKEKFETSEKAESYDIPKTDKVKPSSIPSAKKASTEDLVGIDLIMSGAKKKPSVDAFTKEEGYHKFDEEAQSKKLDKYKKMIKSRSEK
jgi:hypothetical protein